VRAEGSEDPRFFRVSLKLPMSFWGEQDVETILLNPDGVSRMRMDRLN
jgi:hypothetical protein